MAQADGCLKYNHPVSNKPPPPRLLTVTQHGGSVPKPHMPTLRSRQQEDTTYRVLRLLQANPDITQREIAQQLGMSTSGLNYCLKALIDKGLVKMHNFSQSKNKFGYIYVLTPQGMAQKAALTSRFLKRKMQEYEALKAEIESLQADAGSASSLEKDHQATMASQA
jgi:EPS-associated MarR family transcriptional regulator